MDATYTADTQAAQVYSISTDLPCEACGQSRATHYASHGRPCNLTIGKDLALSLYVCDRCAEKIMFGAPLREGSRHARS